MQFWALIFVHFHTSMSSRILAATFIFSVLSLTFFKFISNILKYFIAISISKLEKWNNLSVKVCWASLFSYISFSELIFLIYLLIYLWYFDISFDIDLTSHISLFPDCWLYCRKYVSRFTKRYGALFLLAIKNVFQ